MQWNRLRIILIVILGLVIGLAGCDASDDTTKTFEPGNNAITIPVRAVYAYSSFNDSIAIFDMDNNRVVGVHHICPDSEFVGDFTIGPDGSLYFPVTQTELATMSSGDTSGKIIRVMNPSTGQVIHEIEVLKRPRRIYTLPNGKALIEHSHQEAGAENIACTLLDMNSNTIENVFHLDGIVGGVLESPTGKLYINLLDVLNQYGGLTLIEFDPEAGAPVGAPIVLGTGTAEVACFISDSHIYTQIISNDEESGAHAIGVIEFPSGKLLKKIATPGIPRTLLVVGEKAYVTCFSGTPNDVDSGRGLLVIDTTTDTVVKTIEISPGPQCTVYSDAIGYIYVGCVEGNISIVDPSTDELVETIQCEQLRSWGINQIKTGS